MRRGRVRIVGVFALVAGLLLALASPTYAATDSSRAQEALRQLARDVKSSGVAKTQRKQLAKDLTKAAGSVKGSRACKAIGSVAGTRLAAATIKSKKSRGRLLASVRRAESRLRRLPAVRKCAPPMKKAKVRAVQPTFDPNLKGPEGEKEQGEEEEAHDIPRDPRAKPQNPQGDEAAVVEDEATSNAQKPNIFRSQITEPVRILTSRDVDLAMTNLYPHEPQIAKSGDVIVYSGNTRGYVSTNGGNNFVPLDLGRVFGNDGGLPFCCDTVVRYAPRIDRFLFLMQYWCAPPNTRCDGPTRNNRYRLAVVSPATLRANAADPSAGWTVFDFTTQRYGTNTWFDYPDMAVGSDYLYMTWNLVGVGTANTRVPLRQLTRGAGSTLDIQWFQGTDIFYRVAQNAGNVAFFVKNATDSRDVAYVWPDLLPFPLTINLPHATRPDFNHTHYTPSGQNWMDRIGSGVVKGATRRGNELWVAWTAGRFYNAQGSGRSWPQPHIQYAVWDTADITHLLFTGSFRKIRDGYIWSSTTAYGNPILATNSENDVGITFAYGSANRQPTPGVGVLTNGRVLLRAALSNAPGPVVQGDYAGLQPDHPDSRRFVAANTYTRSGSSGVQPYWLYTRFGRAPAPETPPPQRTPTSIRLERATGTQYDCCFTADVIQVFGQLQGAPPNSQVTIEYRTPSGGFHSTQTVTTDPSGYFRGTFTPSPGQSGAWTVVARYGGNADFAPSQSEPFYVSVADPPG